MKIKENKSKLLTTLECSVLVLEEESSRCQSDFYFCDFLYEEGGSCDKNTTIISLIIIWSKPSFMKNDRWMAYICKQYNWDIFSMCLK